MRSVYDYRSNSGSKINDMFPADVDDDEEDIVYDLGAALQAEEDASWQGSSL